MQAQAFRCEVCAGLFEIERAWGRSRLGREGVMTLLCCRLPCQPAEPNPSQHPQMNKQGGQSCNEGGELGGMWQGGVEGTAKVWKM